MGIYDRSSRSTFVTSHTDVGQEGLALSLRSNSSQRCFIGLRSGLCAGQSSSSTPNSLLQEGAVSKLFPQSWELELSNISCYAEAFRVPVTGTKGTKPSSWRTTPHHNPPPTNFTLGTIQSDRYRSPGNRQTHTRPSDRQMEKSDSSLQITRLHCSRVQWRRALHNCIRRLLMYDLAAAARPWKLIPWSSLRTAPELIWRPHEVWRSVAF